MLFDFLGLYPYCGHKILTWLRLPLPDNKRNACRAIRSPCSKDRSRLSPRARNCNVLLEYIMK